MNNIKSFTLKSQNIKPKIESDIKPFLRRLSQKEYIEGIVLLGGLAKRNFLDKYSDIDIAIFYKTNTLSKYFLPFEFHINLNGTMYEFNIHQLFYEKELDRVWDESTKEAYLRGKTYFDRNDKILSLIKSKTKFNNRIAYNRLIWIMEQYVWRTQIHSLRTYHRGYPEGAHDLLNESIELLIESIYLLNKRFRPHRKWQIVMLRTMNILPEKLFENLSEAMKVKDFTINDINRRINVLNEIYFEIYKIITKTYINFPKEPYVYYYKNFFQLIKNTFSQKIKAKYKDILSVKEVEQFEGLLCFNLVSSPSQAIKYLPSKRMNMRKTGKQPSNEIKYKK